MIFLKANLGACTFYEEAASSPAIMVDLRQIHPEDTHINCVINQLYGLLALCEMK